MAGCCERHNEYLGAIKYKVAKGGGEELL